MYLVIDLSV